MTDFSRRALWLAAAALLPLGLTACDSDDPTPQPQPQPGVCESAATNQTLGCAIAANEVRYDTLNAGEVQVTDLGQGVAPRVGTVRWTANNEYILNGRVFVNDGQTLEIEPGTVIRGRPGQGERSSALIVAQGGMIMANGTAADPIVMTSLGDDLAIADDQPLGGGQWGGLIVLGSAGLNVNTATLNIEGIPTTEPRGTYGGTDDDDNSGIIRYVSIRYGGTLIGDNNEINGLTLGGVGRGTTIEYVEVFSNADDGVEFFGGTVNTKYMVVAFSDDDSFDTDQGYRGLNQYWLAVQREGDGDNGAEMDGGDDELGGFDSQPYSNFVVANATFIGSGLATGNSGLGRALRIRESSAAQLLPLGLHQLRQPDQHRGPHRRHRRQPAAARRGPPRPPGQRLRPVYRRQHAGDGGEPGLRPGLPHGRCQRERLRRPAAGRDRARRQRRGGLQPHLYRPGDGRARHAADQRVLRELDLHGRRLPGQQLDPGLDRALAARLPHPVV